MMQIQDYYFWPDAARQPETVGNPRPEWLDAAGKWLKYLSFEPEKDSFFELPFSGEERLILLALPGDGEQAVCFALPAETFRNLPSCYALYAALLSFAMPRTGAPLTLDFPQCQVDPTPIEAVFSELQGRQMVGDIGKSLLTVSRMLPKDHPETWFQCYFLAVNPNAYADDYTTVVCGETPDGEWQKLKSEHTEYSSAQSFRVRKRMLMRRRMRPRFLLQFILFAIVGLVLLSALAAALYSNRKLEAVNRNLRDRIRTQEFHALRIDDLERARDAQTKQIQTFEQLRDAQTKQIQTLERLNAAQVKQLEEQKSKLQQIKTMTE